MKKTVLSILAMILALLLSLALFAACKKAPDDKKQEPAEQPQEQGETTPDPDNVDAEGHELPKPTISVARISGDYRLSGTKTWDDFKDDTQDETEEISFTMNIFPSGENSLSVTVIPDDEPSESYTVTDYDPLKGTCTLVDEELEIHLTFSESVGKIAVSMQFDKTYEDARFYGSYTGQKK